MKLRFLSIIILLYAITGYSVAYTEVGKSELNLDKIADDLKYSNASRFVKINRIDKALEELNEYLEIFDNGIHRHEALNEIAKIYYQRFNFQKAIKTYRILYQEFNNSEDGISAYYNMGLCYNKMGFSNRAESIFRNIVKDHPDSGFAHHSMVQLDLLKIIR